MTEKTSPAVMRSMLGRSRGLGSAKSGSAHWWSQRLTAFALIPLTLWFVFSCVHLIGLSRAEVAHWAANPVTATLLVAMIVVTFHHLQMGLQVVIEDYVHGEGARITSIVLNKGVCALLALAALIAVLKLAITG